MIIDPLHEFTPMRCKPLHLSVVQCTSTFLSALSGSKIAWSMKGHCGLNPLKSSISRPEELKKVSKTVPAYISSSWYRHASNYCLKNSWTTMIAPVCTHILLTVVSKQRPARFPSTPGHSYSKYITFWPIIRLNSIAILSSNANQFYNCTKVSKHLLSFPSLYVFPTYWEQFLLSRYLIQS